jgi:hypothetical protein
MTSPRKRKFPWDHRLKRTIHQLADGKPLSDWEIRDIIIRVLRMQVDKVQKSRPGKP